jgi:hypothetical protein
MSSKPPIYGYVNTPCPTTPPANTRLLEYIQRAQDILQQLNNKKDKENALTRLNILISEVKTE